MTEEELDAILEENDYEILFHDGSGLTDWSGGRYCVYMPGKQFGEGHPCYFEDARDFYLAHAWKEKEGVWTNHSGLKNFTKF